jgi:hypothetical protein
MRKEDNELSHCGPIAILLARTIRTFASFCIN